MASLTAFPRDISKAPPKCDGSRHEKQQQVLQVKVQPWRRSSVATRNEEAATTGKRSTATRSKYQTASKAAASPQSSLFSQVASHLCNVLEDLVNSSNPPPVHLTNSHLASNFSPLPHESPPSPCPLIHGSIPPSLNGVFLRNGPNPLHPPKAGYHYFDGDGMIHSVRISNAHAVHACRFTRTNRYIQEKATGQPLFVKPLGELHGLSGFAKISIMYLRHALGLADILQGIGPANAGLVYFDGKVLAMSEDDMPYWVYLSDDGDVHTVGRFDFAGKLNSSMTAHPKVDPTTGTMFSYSYNLTLPPYLKYFWVTPDGQKSKEVSITLKEPTLIHDFAITKRYAVFCENQMVFRLQDMLKGGSPIVCDANKVPRVGILPKYDSNEANIRWFDCPISSGACFHYLNAWEEGEKVVMVGSLNQPLECIFTCPEKLENRLTEFRLNLKTGKATIEQVSYANIDVGRINENYLGKKTRYAYMSTSGPWPKYSGVCKVDLEAPRLSEPKARRGAPGLNTCEPCIVGWRPFGEGRYGSEPFFVPKSADSSVSEDDGFLLTFVHDEVNDHSELLIMDAQSADLAIVASITMPSRVPYGFHSLFVSEAKLQEQESI